MAEGDAREIDVETLMRQVRERGPDGMSEPRESADTSVSPDASLAEAADIEHVAFVSHRHVLGRFVVSVKEVLRKLLTPILLKQTQYNLAIGRLVREQGDRARQEMHDSRLFREAVQRWHETFHERQAAADAQQLSMSTRQDGLDARVARLERGLRRFEHFASERAAGSASGVSPGATRAPEPATASSEFDYVGFENRYRGDEREVKDRQRRYLELFGNAGDVIDLGCGRGEFLDLLKEAGLRGTGVDAGLDMVLLCREKGLDVEHADAFKYLESLPDGSVGGFFSAQFIEHLPAASVIRLVKLCARKLRARGVLVLETPNPACLAVFGRSFYMDFSHVWPCHPEAMRYLLESSGFEAVRLLFSSPVDPMLGIPPIRRDDVFGDETERFNRTAAFLNDLLLGPQDYAVIGIRTEECA